MPHSVDWQSSVRRISNNIVFRFGQDVRAPLVVEAIFSTAESNSFGPCRTGEGTSSVPTRHFGFHSLCQ